MKKILVFVPISIFVVIFVLGDDKMVINYDDQKYNCTDKTVINNTLNGACVTYQNDKKSGCNSAVLFAHAQGFDLEVVAMGVAVGKRHILTTVTANFRMVINDAVELVIIRGDQGYLLKNNSIIPKMIPGEFDIHGWNDILYIELPESSGNFSDSNFVEISQSVPPEENNDGDGAFIISDKAVTFNSGIASQSLDKCADAFEPYPVFVHPDYLYCRFDKDYNEEAAFTLLPGSPLYVNVPNNNTVIRYVTGLRSMTEKGWFLVTKLSKQCDWLQEVSAGDVLCVT